MSEAQFPSGQWIGFYNYPDRARKYPMDLILKFSNGIIRGEGSDGVGLFGINGRYYPKEAECTWVKTYFGRHSVDYVGFREQIGIWGTWSIREFAKGGFHIWPIEEGEPIEKLKKQTEQEIPVRIWVPQEPSVVPATPLTRLQPPRLRPQ